MSKNLEKKLIASMQGIALDSINKAGQGHIGMAIGAAPITEVLFTKFLKINRSEPKWINRDRFVLSAGHGSMSMYSIMNFLGLLSVEDMKEHKHLHSKTPSHPEIDANDFVDASTGPLGQGVAMGVGMAVSQRILAKKFNKEGFPIFEHDVFVLHGDGCIQEGVALEAIQFAGTNKLDKLILIHDYNAMQIDSSAEVVNNIDLSKYFESQGFDVFVVKNHEPEMIKKAIEKARKSTKPSYVQIHTIIAEHTPVENTSKGHNGTLKEDVTVSFKQKIGLENTTPFVYDNDVYEYAQSFWKEKDRHYEKWVSMYEEYRKTYPELAKELENLYVEKEYDLSKVEFDEHNVATRNYIATIMKYIDANYPEFVGGSADLYAATKVGFKSDFHTESGQNIHYGIREFAMGAINNGILLDGGLRTVSSTFLAFADYMKPAIRLGALMQLPVIHVFTHDSYQVGGDGPTHQPFDQIPMLRAMANVKVVRPCDESEMRGAFEYAMNAKNEQVAIIGCRQPVKSFNLTPKKMPAAYLVKNDISQEYKVSLLASGSEVGLALDVANELEKTYNIKTQVISVPILQDLIENDSLCLSLGLDKAPMFVIEPTSDAYWYKLSKYNKLDGQFANSYGYSEDGQKVYELKGFNVSNIVTKVLKLIK